MRTSFHHQPEAQHPNFQLSISWQADYPIFWGEVRTCAAASSQSPPSLLTQSRSEQAISCRDHLFRITNPVLRAFPAV
jgi:hypothetical protein